MRRTDHIFAITSALMTSSKNNLSAALGTTKDFYLIDDLRQPNHVSIGVLQDNHEQTLSSWITRIRAASLSKVVFAFVDMDHKGLPAHTAAAFAGSSDLIMEATTETGTRTYLLQTFFSPRYQITLKDFMFLVDSQEDKPLAWERVCNLIQESNALNERNSVNASEIRTYLASKEGHQVFNSMAGDLIKEMQIELAVHDHAFIIPDSLRSAFVKYDTPSFLEDDREYVYLYPLTDVTADQIIALVRAQPFNLKTWEKLNTTLEEYADPDMPTVDPQLWESNIVNMPQDQVTRFISPICQSICRLCEEANIKPVIPENLANLFGPNELDQKRAAARSKASANSYYLQPTSEPWEHYQFFQIENIKASTVLAKDTRENFITSLEEIRQFASLIQSPFEEAFRLSHFVLTTDLPNGTFDEAHLTVIDSKLKDAGFSERAIESFRNTSNIAESFTSMGWEMERVRGLIAVSVADVFGGMGSWNDQYVEGDQERYQTVSALLFDTLRKYLASLLSSSANPV